MDTAISLKSKIPSKPGIRRSFLLAGINIAAADWLFYDRHIGISVCIAVAVVAASVVAGLSKPAPRRRVAVAAGLLVMSVLPVLEFASTLSILIAVMGSAVFAVLVNQDIPVRIETLLFKSTCLLTSGPFELIRTARQMKRAGRRAQCRRSLAEVLLPWAVPAGLGLVFLLLFRLANPMIESWLASLVPDMSGSTFESGRIVFWAGTLIAVWPFVRLRRSSTSFPAPPAIDGPEQTVFGGRYAEALFGTGTVIRSLAAFNALFLVQTGLDLLYLWGGTSLPIGVTHAEYAHRGAYPLVVTALLAAAVILIAMRPGSPTETHPTVRRLVYLWTAQNVVLVMSSMFRLKIYIAEYSLTYLRVAAFIWMGLVAAGLLLIVARIVFSKSNRWLVSANISTLVATLYICAFVNFPYFIAAYNLAHAGWLDTAQTSSFSRSLDVPYLCNLGVHALPAMEAAMPPGSKARAEFSTCIGNDMGELLKNSSDWRTWGLRNRRLLDHWNNPHSSRSFPPPRRARQQP